MKRAVGIALVMLSQAIAAAASEPLKIDDPADKQIVETFLKHTDSFHRMVTPQYCRRAATEKVTDYTWVIPRAIDTMLAAYEVTGDAAYLDKFVAMFATCREEMTKDAQGYLGWYGKTLPGIADPSNPDKKVDELLNSFATTDLLSRFIEATDRDAALKAKFAAQRTEYLDLIEKHLIPKWDARGCFVDLGNDGAVYRGNTGLRDTQNRLTKPHNMHAIVIHGLLSLYRVTGKDEYMARAVKLGTRFKRCLTLKDGHYEWDYWDPAGPWDIHPTEPGKWKHWIGVEHTGGYYASTLSQAVDLYEHGVVFDRTDIERLLKTQMAVCWNGDAVNPKWARVDGTTSDKYMVGAYVCPALAPYNEKLADFVYGRPGQKHLLDNATSTWQSGILAVDWIRGKFIDLPQAAGGKPLRADAAERFRAKEASRKLLESLAFKVTEPGYKPPTTPSAMADMPKEPPASGN